MMNRAARGLSASGAQALACPRENAQPMARCICVVSFPTEAPHHNALTVGFGTTVNAQYAAVGGVISHRDAAKSHREINFGDLKPLKIVARTEVRHG